MILIKYDAKSINFQSMLNPTNVGILYLLSYEGSNKYVSVEEFCHKYSCDVVMIKQVITSAANLKIVDVKTEVNDNDTVIIVSNYVEAAAIKPKVDLIKISLLLGIEVEQVKNCYDMSNGDISFFKTLILNIITAKQNNYPIPNIVINTKEDLFAFLSHSTVFDIIAARGARLNAKDLGCLIDLTNSSLSIPVLNCLVDFSIKSNEYNNLNPNFVNKVVATWESNKVDSIEGAIDLINVQKANMNTSRTTFVEPTYEKFATEQVFSQTDAEELINNVFN